MKAKRLFIIISLLLVANGFVQAQFYPYPPTNVISTAAPFLSYSIDARASAMGECGVATDADAFSMYYNPAKYAFMKDDRTMVAAGNVLVGDPETYLHGAFAQKIGKSALAVTLRYYKANDIDFRDQNNNLIGVFSARGLSADAGYSIRLGDFLSVGVAGRFVYYNLTQGLGEYYRSCVSIAGDAGAYYYRPLGRVVDLSLGASITNVGTKMSYSSLADQKHFIPTTMRLGTGVKFKFNQNNSLAVNLQFSKLLVPSTPIRDYTGEVLYGYDDDVSVLRGMIQSFYDAPGWVYDSYSGEMAHIGTFYEELCEINTGIGLEYNLFNHGFFRSGYYHQPVLKGGKKYLTWGAGMRFGIFGMDVSYAVPVNTVAGTSPNSSIIRWDMYFAF